MATSNFNLRGISSDMMVMLKHKAKEQHTSVNHLIISTLEQGLGYSKKVKKHVYHELDYLAGTWTKSDVKSFENNTKSFEMIDKELWT